MAFNGDNLGTEIVTALKGAGVNFKTDETEILAHWKVIATAILAHIAINGEVATEVAGVTAGAATVQGEGTIA